jgi:hypothetical protein
MLKRVATLAFVIALAGSAATPTLQQSLSMKQPIGVRISPDGRYVAYLVQQPTGTKTRLTLKSGLRIRLPMSAIS